MNVKDISKMDSLIGKEFHLGLGKMTIKGYGVNENSSYLDLRWEFVRKKKSKRGRN